MADVIIQLQFSERAQSDQLLSKALGMGIATDSRKIDISVAYPYRVTLRYTYDAETGDAKGYEPILDGLHDENIALIDHP